MFDAVRRFVVTPLRRRRKLHYVLRNLTLAPAEWLPTAMARRRMSARTAPIVFIVGCGRSGTSFTARMLSSAGLLLPGRHTLPDEFNPDGYLEDEQVVAVNSDILWGSGGHWYTPPEALRVYAYQRDRIVRLLAWLCSHPGAVGWKDPRGTLTMAAWLDVARELGITCHLVGVFRNHAAVANSIVRHERGVLGFDEALRAWCVSNTRLLELAGASPDCFSWFTIDQPAAVAEANLNAIARRLGLPGLVRLDRGRQDETGANADAFDGEAAEIYRRLRAAHAAQQTASASADGLAAS